MVPYKTYNIQITGRVQDVGFRNLVENIARSLGLRGMVYNDIDGTVKIVCGGAVSNVKNLIKEIRIKSPNVGASIDEVNQAEVDAEIFLPPIFFKAPTDELSDISKKLDVGIESIQGIERNTGSLTTSTHSLVKSTQSLVKGQEKMVTLLEKIAEK